MNNEITSEEVMTVYGIVVKPETKRGGEYYLGGNYDVLRHIARASLYLSFEEAEKWLKGLQEKTNLSAKKKAGKVAKREVIIRKNSEGVVMEVEDHKGNIRTKENYCNEEDIVKRF